MQTTFLCISVLKVALVPRIKWAGCKSALNPAVVYSTDRSKAVVLVLFLFFCSFVVPTLLFFFYIFCSDSIMVTVFNSCLLCFLFY